MQTKFYVTIGDWSNDGHGKYDKYLVEANKSIPDIRDAYKAAVKACGVTFDKGYGDDRTHGTEILARYQDRSITAEVAEKLRGIGVTFNELDTDASGGFYFSPQTAAELFMQMAKTQLPGLEYKFIEDEIPSINGYWAEGFNYGFGYGCYE